MSNKKLFFIFFIIYSIYSVEINAQVAQERFGQNRIQYSNFKWKYYNSDNFEVYYYEGGEGVAKMAIQYLEEEFNYITDLLGYAPYSKTKVFLYNSIKDLQQSNVGVNANPFTIGGQTILLKSLVQVAYQGQAILFKKELLHKVSSLFINEMMFGGNLLDMVQSSYLMTLPEWFTQGVALYISEGWSVEMDTYIRDLLKHQKVKKFNRYNGEEAAIIGQSVWNYIVEKNGRSSISNILNLTRVIRNEEKSIASSIGIPFKYFVEDWRRFYIGMNEEVFENYAVLPSEKKLKKWNSKKHTHKNVRLSPDGQFAAFSENNNGRYKVKIINLETKKEETVLAGGYKVINQRVDKDIPLLSWKDNTSLGIISTKKGKYILWVYDFAAKSKQRIFLDQFDQVRSFDFSDNGKMIVVSASVQGKNDLYLVSLLRNATKQLTYDTYDDLDPHFIPKSNNIVFSSNRSPGDSLQQINKLEQIGSSFNLFLCDPQEDKENRITPLTNTFGKNLKPIPKNENIIYYISDQRGIKNLFTYNLQDSIYTQVSNFAMNIRDYDINFPTSSLILSQMDNSNDIIFYLSKFYFDRQIFTEQTPRNKNKVQKERLTEISKRKEKISPNDSILNHYKKQQLEGVINTDYYFFEDELPQKQINKSDTSATSLIDTDNYSFTNPANTTASLLSKYRNLQKKSWLSGPYQYHTEFSTDNFILSPVVDPLRGISMLVEVQMNDILENHKFFGGFLLSTNLRSGKFFGEYQYKKQRIDYHARYERNTLLVNAEIFQQKYILNQFEVGAALPLSVTSRIKLSPYFTNTRSIDLDPNILSLNPSRSPIDTKHNYGGLRAEFVFDNTKPKGLNIFHGTRFKTVFKHYQNLENKQYSFSNVSVDFRHYQKIYREITLAVRTFYGGFFGNNKQKYLLGGMDNWLFNNTDFPGEENDPLVIDRTKDNSNLLFLEYATNLRGFNYNTLNGTNVLLLNAELRLPPAKVFYRGFISSNFFRNLQVIGFYDVGSAWTDRPPFSKENDINTKVIKSEGSNFEATIKNFKNPWLQSYGFGLRTVLLGYYIKFDVAWPIEDSQIKSSKLYFTLGYDF